MNGKTDKKMMIFAGTTEGRILAEYAENKKIPCYVSTATEYGNSILANFEFVDRIFGRMNEEQMRIFLREKGISFVIDATHPFALEVTENIKRACRTLGIRYIRCLREGSHLKKNKDFIYVNSVKEAVDFLDTVPGKVFIATGSNELDKYTAIDGWKDRCYARVLSSKEAVFRAAEIGFEGSHLIAMQGPFSTELNTEMLKQTGADYFVTKESGKAGGFEEKINAAAAVGVVPIIIVRPDEEGKYLNEVKLIIDEL